jgi:iron complex outermembrane receptor protein
MKQILFLSTFLLLNNHILFSQQAFEAYIVDAATDEVLIGATAQISGTGIVGRSDAQGDLRLTAPPVSGLYTIIIRYVGYQEQRLSITFPLIQAEPTRVALEPDTELLEEVLVSATRSSRSIDDSPTRIETISSHELDEKSNMQPANVRLLLTESTGIQTQQTSAASANASIRIQGLDGKYTLLLKDGLPLYSGFAGGLSIVQIPPLDLKRVEVIKGASSTLYGGGAIAGLINFVTKTPTERKELSLMSNISHAGALDLSAFYGQKFGKTGLTLFAARNSHTAYDPAQNGFSDIPQQSRYTLNPRFFYYPSQQTTISLGLNTSFEDRLGGDMRYIRAAPADQDLFFERNLSRRVASQFQLDHRFGQGYTLTAKNSVSFFDRSIKRPTHLFEGQQWASFSELSLLRNRERSEWIVGANWWTDRFVQTDSTDFPLDNRLLIGGVFIQNSFKVNAKMAVESGLRADLSEHHRLFVLPRLSVMYRLSPALTARFGAGMGYKTPTVFSEEVEARAFRNIQAPNLALLRPERSVGANIDLNYKTLLWESISLSINQLAFYTRLNSPLLLNTEALPNGNYALVNAEGFLSSQGLETNLKLGYEDFSLYGGYTLINARRHFDNTISPNPLTARHRIYMTLMYELEEKLRIGYELFYTGHQVLSNDQVRPDYWVMGLSIEYRWKEFSLFLNAENFTDTRQTRYESIYTGTRQSPEFNEIWAPTDGFIFNGGLKIRVW